MDIKRNNGGIGPSTAVHPGFWHYGQSSPNFASDYIRDTVNEIVSEFARSVRTLAGTGGSAIGYGSDIEGSRYVIGGFSDSLVLSVATGADPAARYGAALAYAEQNRAKLAEGYGLGWWLANGRIWFDVTYTTNNRDNALQTGAKNGELAIWDNSDMVEIKIS